MSRYICEACDRGYSTTLKHCPSCGAGNHVAHISDVTSCFDTECYSNYWTCRFDTGESFQMFEGNPLDIAGLSRTLSRYTLVSFNGQGYDLPIIEAALQGANNSRLKQLSDTIIVGQEKLWHRLDWIDHIDIMNVLPGMGGQKAYGAKNNTKTLQDLPYDPGIITDWVSRWNLFEYCGVDLTVLRELFEKFQTQLKLRVEIGAEYGMDVRSKSDPQIAEAVLKSLLPFKPVVPYYAKKTPFYYHAPAWVKFVNLDLLERVIQLPFHINESGGVSPNYHMDFVDWGSEQKRLDAHGQWVKRPKDWKPSVVSIGGTTYTVGIGGLHSNETSAYHMVDDETILADWDVASYYPSLILNTGIFPKQIGPVFNKIYNEWYELRLEAKHAGIKKTADSLKLFLNGLFGKLNSKYSIVYGPPELIQVTITGQLALLMLIETMELSGIRVISANTDGIILKYKPEMNWLVEEIIHAWEKQTGLVMEETRYKLIAAMNVNSYVAITTDGKVKLKGALAPAEAGQGWPNPTGEICVTAIVEHLKNGTPIEQTIRDCKDVTKFLYVRAVTGGGILNRRPFIPKKTTKTNQRELLRLHGLDDYEELVEWSTGASEYLGKTVRWYYGEGSTDWIQYKQSGNQVPRAQGVIPCMTLPDEFPDDIDYNWYIKESQSIMTNIGVLNGI